MSFLDQKEEVLDIELTQYGKHLLSKGKFSPVFYAFFDDDILYDTEYVGYGESQNDSEDRIKITTPQNMVQYLFHGAETEIKNINEMMRANRTQLGSEKVQPTAEKAYAMSAPLGNSSILTDNIPAFNINYLKGELSGSVNTISGSFQNLKIPQLSSSVMFETFIDKKKDLLPSENEQQEIMEDENTKIFEDGTFIKVKKDFIFLQIIEKNTSFENENFDIEVFLREDVTDTNISGSTKENLVPLSFVKRQSNIKSSLTLDEKELEQNFPELDSSYVEYFFDIDVDSEINREVFCENRVDEKSENIFADVRVDCSDEAIKKQQGRKDIFKEEVEEFEDCD